MLKSDFICNHGAVGSDDGSKPEVLSQIEQIATAALTNLKQIRRGNNIMSFGSNKSVWLFVRYVNSRVRETKTDASSGF